MYLPVLISGQIAQMRWSKGDTAEQ